MSTSLMYCEFADTQIWWSHVNQVNQSDLLSDKTLMLVILQQVKLSYLKCFSLLSLLKGSTFQANENVC